VTKIPPAILTLLIANTVVWGAPAALFGLLFLYHVRAGTWSPFLLLIGALPYAVGLAISFAGVVVLWKQGELSAARAMGVTFLILGFCFAGCSVLAVGTI
jgi:hypothetical protein